ncbi:MAG: hypothetical protein A2203_11375 [Chromatiales bacterium RIFOXYA1_FULL_46_5]|nr:MAG: hypothetical protein A2203_11375 [Chromatiales bacterium RIFOXYA1_FULL_46_5]
MALHEKIQCLKSLFQMLQSGGAEHEPDKSSLKVADDRVITAEGEKRSVSTQEEWLFFAVKSSWLLQLVRKSKHKKNALSSNLSALKGLRFLLH